MEVTINLPKPLYQHVAAMAEARQKSVADIIQTAVRKELATEAESAAKYAESISQSVAFCSDAEVLALARLRLPDDERLSLLLEKNREGRLPRTERAELRRLVEFSQKADVRKAIGLTEAMKRGLITGPDELL